MENEKDPNKQTDQDVPEIPQNLVNQGLVFFNFLGGFTPKKELPIPEGDLPTLGDDFFKGVQL